MISSNQILSKRKINIKINKATEVKQQQQQESLHPQTVASRQDHFLLPLLRVLQLPLFLSGQQSTQGAVG